MTPKLLFCKELINKINTKKAKSLHKRISDSFKPLMKRIKPHILLIASGKDLNKSAYLNLNREKIF